MRFKYSISICDDNDENECPKMAGSFPIKREYVYEIIKGIINFTSDQQETDVKICRYHKKEGYPCPIYSKCGPHP